MANETIRDRSHLLHIIASSTSFEVISPNCFLFQVQDEDQERQALFELLIPPLSQSIVDFVSVKAMIEKVLHDSTKEYLDHHNDRFAHHTLGACLPLKVFMRFN